MAGMQTGSTVPRRQLGRHLRQARAEAGFTVAGAAKALGWSDQKIWRLETGQTSANPFDVGGMCRLYGATERATAALAALARETKAKGWWHAFSDVTPIDFSPFIGLEQSASEISCFDNQLVPGLLQTSDYIRVIMKVGHPGADDAEIDRRITFRLARQAIVTRPVDPPHLLVVLSEAVLRQSIGSPKIMHFQLRRLLESSELPNVQIRVVPLDARFHRGLLSCPFVLHRFAVNRSSAAPDREPPVVFLENHIGALYFDQPHEVERYEEILLDLMDVTRDNANRDRMVRAMKELRW